MLLKVAFWFPHYKRAQFGELLCLSGHVAYNRATRRLNTRHMALRTHAMQH
jgi:hypothetical protein